MNEPIKFDPSTAAKASEDETKAFQQKLTEARVLADLQQANWIKRHAWERGKDARESGRFRTCPFYEDPYREQAWLDGYDGKPEPTLDVILKPVLNDPVLST